MNKFKRTLKEHDIYGKNKNFMSKENKDFKEKIFSYNCKKLGIL